MRPPIDFTRWYFLNDADARALFEKQVDLFLASDTYRGLMIDRRFWPANVRSFEHRWSRYKRELGLLDFNDLIDIIKC